MCFGSVPHFGYTFYSLHFQLQLLTSLFFQRCATGPTYKKVGQNPSKGIYIYTHTLLTMHLISLHTAHANLTHAPALALSCKHVMQCKLDSCTCMHVGRLSANLTHAPALALSCKHVMQCKLDSCTCMHVGRLSTAHTSYSCNVQKPCMRTGGIHGTSSMAC